MTESVRRCCARAAADPFFAAHLLAASGLTDAELCAALGCDADALAHVRLCPRPVSRADVERIAASHGVDAEGLAGVCGIG